MVQEKPPQSTDAAALMFMTEMRKERSFFWGILVVFFLLLAIIASFFAYEMFSFADRVRNDDFRFVGENAQKFSDMRTNINAVQTAQTNRDDDVRAASQQLDVAVRAAREPAKSLVGDALVYARKQFLGRPLNDSTARVVAAAATAATGQDRTLLKAALADWQAESRPGAEWANGDEELAKLAAGMMESDNAAFGHVAMAAIAFRKSQAPGSNSAWDKGCEEAVAEATKAEELGIRGKARSSDDDGAVGFNLQYWHAHCLRKNNQPEVAAPIFEAMIANPALEKLLATSTFRVQAYHGLGTTQIAMANSEQDAAKASDLRKKARANLENSAKLRTSRGADPSVAFGTTENIGFLILRDDSTTKLDDALDHTQLIDSKLSQTWNIVVQLAAATKLYRDGGSDKYKTGDLKRIAFESYAKLAQQSEGSLNEIEVSALIGPDEDFQAALRNANTCVKNHVTCLSLAKGFGS